MFFQRYYLECLSHASYMVADETTKTAAVIDPRRDIDLYLDDARERGYEIKHVILTYFHADFVAGHIELRDKVGACIHLGARARAEFAFNPLSDGSIIALGEDTRLVVMETPGHTPEGISLLAFDNTIDSKNPQSIFTGDTLFLGDVGRPDLFASVGVSAQELARMLYNSLHNKILKLPDATLVYPAHGAGSMCGKALSDQEVSTLGEQRRYNYALQPMTEEEFIRMITADQPEAPAYFGYDASLNQQERPNLEESMAESFHALDLTTVLELQQSGAVVLDVRDAPDFASAHLRHSINIGIDGKFATWCGTLLNKDIPIVIVAEPHHVTEAMIRLGRIGFNNVRGFLKEGMNSLNARADLISKTQRISPTTLREYEGETTILDIRSENERKAGHITNSIHIPLNHLVERVKEVPFTGVVIVHCQGGYRSMIAASLLEKENRDNVLDLAGGYQAWVTTQNPVHIPIS